MWIYILLSFLFIVVAVLMLHLRVKFKISKDEKLLFAGLGRTGGEFNFSSKKGVFKLFGFSITKFDISGEKDKSKEKKETKKIRKQKEKRSRSLKYGSKLIPQVFTSFKNFIFSVIESIVIEELDGDIKAGFNSPHITGQVYGYYQAVTAVLPNFNNRFTFSPVWDKTTFDGELNGSISIPLYMLLYRFMIFIVSLPLIKIYVFIRGKKKGGRNG